MRFDLLLFITFPGEGVQASAGLNSKTPSKLRKKTPEGEGCALYEKGNALNTHKCLNFDIGAGAGSCALDADSRQSGIGESLILLASVH